MLVLYIDYYLFFIIFFVLCLILLPTLKFFNYNFLNDFRNSFKLNLIQFIFLIFKIIILLVIIYHVDGYVILILNKNEIINNILLFKNILLLFKIFFFIFVFLFLFLFESYLKLVNWINIEILILFYFCIMSLAVILFTDNFLNFYLLLELYTLSIISVIGLRKIKNKLFIEAVLKYFVINAISSCFILFGISIIYSYSGLINFLDLRLFFWHVSFHINYLFINLGIFFLLIGFFIKLGLFPFNYWFLDIYEYVPLPLTFFLLTIPKFIFSCFLFIFFNLILSDNIFFLNLILYVSILTFLMNNIIAIYQIKLKKLFITSSLANIPFFLLFIYLKTFNAIISFYLFVFIYYLNLFSIFIFLLFFYNSLDKSFFKKLTHLVGLFFNNKLLIFIFSLFLLSLAGLPPLSGFFAKFYFLIMLLNNYNISLFLLFSFGNLIVIFYYLRLVKLLFQVKNNFNYKLLFFNSFLLLLFYIIIFLFNIFIIIYFDILYNLIIFLLLVLEWIY